MMRWIGYRLRFATDEGWSPPPFAGSMLRGAFGSALKRTVCVMRLRPCEGCPLEHACTYTTVFETRPRPDAGVMTRYDRAPHPFVLVTPILDRRGERGFSAGVRLFGEAAAAAPFVLEAFEEAARRGFGPGRVPHRLEVAEAEPGGSGTAASWSPGTDFVAPPPRPAPPPLPEGARLVFRTPLRLKRDGRLVTPETLDGPTLAMSAVRRVGLLATFFGDGTDGLDFTALKAEAAKTRLADTRLAWRDLTRRSSRQRAELGIGGILGEARLHLGGSPRLAELLGWMPLLHVGKGATMGLGQVEVHP